MEPNAQMPAMADYGVSAGDWRPLPWSWAAERLAVNRNFWVSTVSPAGQPHSLPVWGVWDDTDHQLMFSCSPQSAKARNLAANPRAAVTVSDTVECVSMQGTAALLTDGERIRTWIRRYLAKYGGEMGPDADEFIDANSVFEFTPRLVVAVIERADEFATRATRWRF